MVAEAGEVCRLPGAGGGGSRAAATGGGGSRVAATGGGGYRAAVTGGGSGVGEQPLAAMGDVRGSNAIEVTEGVTTSLSREREEATAARVRPRRIEERR